MREDVAHRDRALERARAAMDRVAQRFAHTVGEKGRRLTEALAVRDCDTICDVCHELAGEAALLGAPLVGRLAALTRDIACDPEGPRDTAAVLLAASAVRLAIDQRLPQNGEKARALIAEITQLRDCLRGRAHRAGEDAA